MSCISTSNLNNERGEWLLVTYKPLDFEIKHSKFKILEKNINHFRGIHKTYIRIR